MEPGSSQSMFLEALLAATTAEQVIAALDNWWPDADNVYYGDYDSALNNAVETVECGGAEGDGAPMYVVIKHLPTGLFFQQTGYYSSWGDSSWDNTWHQVEPVQVVVTKYEPAKK